MPFEDEAPILFSVGITEAQMDTYFENHTEPPAPPVIPPITKVKYIAVANAFFVTGIDKYGGIIKLSQDVKLLTSQVNAIANELYYNFALWQAEQSG